MWHRETIDRRTLGPWSFELRDDEIADVAYDGRLVLRAAQAVVRDRNWNTASLVVDRVDASVVALTLHVHSEGYGSSLRGVVRAEVHPTFLRIEMDLESGAEFDTNRTGLVVLHPPPLAGAQLRVTHPDGSAEASEFPERISPRQPVFDIAAVEWTSPDGVGVSLRFSGDVFEMEDQRNWTDASYKTYSRPLELPFPYRLTAGERVVQWVDISARAGAEPTDAGELDVIELTAAGVFPEIGVGASTAPDPAPVFEPVGDAVLVELDLATAHWRAALTRAAASGRPLDVRLALAADAPGSLTDAVEALASLRVLRIAAFDPELHISDDVSVDALRTALHDTGVGVPVIGGARSHFTELNREQRRVPDDLDGVAFSATPLFHAASTEQLVESVAMQRLVAQQAVDIAGGAPVHIGPVTLRPRFNNVATTTPTGADAADLSRGYGPALLDADDLRQDASELAAWTIASAAALAVPGVASVTYFEEWGPRGIRDDAGVDRPVASAVQALSALSGSRRWSGESPDRLVWALGGGTDAATTVLVANLDRRARTVTVRLADRTVEIEVAPASVQRIEFDRSA